MASTLRALSPALLAVTFLLTVLAAGASGRAMQDDRPPVELPTTSDKLLLDRARVLRMPALSAEARSMGLSGTVAVRVIVDPDGEVVVARAVSGAELLRQTALKAMRSWEFASSPDPEQASGFVVFRFTTGEAYASVEGLHAQDVATGPMRPRAPEPSEANPPAVTTADPAAPATRPRETPPSARTAVDAGPRRLAPGELTALAKRKTAPRYPSAATAARIEGVVIVEVEVDESGLVTGARAVSGNGVLRPAAIEAARQWQFRPTVVDSVPTRVIGTIAFNFRL